ncbi:MAG: hypothetical protein HYX92_13670 [Chloroflexi bacterium]|nr:hypothetical protein [Chloroflexota bacterium]
MKKWAFATLVMIVELVVMVLIFLDVVPLKPMHITEEAEYAKFFTEKEAADVSVAVVRWLVYAVMVMTVLSTAVTILMELTRWALNRRWREHA